MAVRDSSRPNDAGLSELSNKQLVPPMIATLAAAQQPNMFPEMQRAENNLPQRQYHEPPPGVNYEENSSVFGGILRGDLPAITIYESRDLLAFQDRRPCAKLHALVIPKRFVPTVFDLTPADLPMLEDMHQTALQLVEQQFPDAFQNKDYVLCYHIPPFNSVNHLHLHVLAPASEMNMLYRHGKYRLGSRWCTEEAVVRERLKNGRTAVPYKDRRTY